METTKTLALNIIDMERYHYCNAQSHLVFFGVMDWKHYVNHDLILTTCNTTHISKNGNETVICYTHCRT